MRFAGLLAVHARIEGGAVRPMSSANALEPCGVQRPRLPQQRVVELPELPLHVGTRRSSAAAIDAGSFAGKLFEYEPYASAKHVAHPRERGRRTARNWILKVAEQHHLH